MKWGLLLFGCCALVQAEQAVFTTKLELDGFVTNWGPQYYPRVRWAAEGRYGKLTGFGFIYSDRKPGPWFSNHVLAYTPKQASWFSARVETGGTPAGYFAQVSPQLNLQAFSVPRSFAQSLILSYLPALGGARINNWLVSGMSKEVPVKSFGVVYLDTYWRFFPERGIRGTYGEAWLWVKPKKHPHFQFGAIARDNKSDWMLGLGVRVKPW